MLAVIAPATSSAEPWHSGAQGRRRLEHLSAVVIGGALYISSETLLKPTLAPASCRWCEPLSYDVSIRNALRWTDPGRAVAISNVDGFVAAPVAGLGLVALAAVDSGTASPSRLIDDALPIVEAVVVAGLVDQAAKFTVGEQRPFVHFGDPARHHQLDDDVSFYSGHTTLTFAIATSAGVVAHQRGYRLEPVIWAIGYTLAASTGYLRIAGDQHYFTDVVTGALAGTAIGLGVPLLLHGDVLDGHPLEVAPTPTGVSIRGTW